MWVSSPVVAEERLERLPSFVELLNVRRRTTLRGFVFLMCFRWMSTSFHLRESEEGGRPQSDVR